MRDRWEEGREGPPTDQPTREKGKSESRDSGSLGGTEEKRGLVSHPVMGNSV